MNQSSVDRSPLVGIIARQDRSEMWKGYALYGQGLSYVESVARAGGAPMLIPLQLEREACRSIYRRLDGLLFPGGVDVSPAHYGQEPHPYLGQVDHALDETELMLARWALEDDLPVLAICRGIQLINVAAGGSLYQDLPTQFPGALPHACSAPDYPRTYRAHLVHVQQGTRLADALNAAECWTNSRHHQAVRDVAPGFAVTARAPDGVIEAIEHAEASFIVGVQWHPESLANSDPQMLSIFQAHVAACRLRM